MRKFLVVVALALVAGCYTRFTRTLPVSVGLLADSPVSIVGKALVVHGARSVETGQEREHDSSGIEVDITNRTDQPLTIDWDRSALVSPSGETLRVIHGGVRYMEKAAVQAPSVVGPKSRLAETILPADAITYSSGQYGGWSVRPFARAGDRFTLLLHVSGAGTPRTLSFPVSILVEGEAADPATRVPKAAGAPPPPSTQPAPPPAAPEPPPRKVAIPGSQP